MLGPLFRWHLHEPKRLAVNRNAPAFLRDSRREHGAAVVVKLDQLRNDALPSGLSSFIAAFTLATPIESGSLKGKRGGRAIGEHLVD